MSGGGAGMAFLWIIYIAVAVFMIVSMWRVFEKAGQPGWAAIIPIYNIVVMLRIAKRPEWWVLLYFIPLVNIVVGIITYVGIAESFGKDGGFAVGMIFLPFIFFPILAFGEAKYQG